MRKNVGVDDPLADLLAVFDEVADRLLDRLVGVSAAEYRWEPVPGCWAVREVGLDRFEADPVPPTDVEPAPVTTLSWRMHHLASDCLASYTSRGLGDWPLEVHGLQWYGEPGPAVEALGTSLEALRDGLAALGPAGLQTPLGPAWGQWADSTWLRLGLHALDELAHHGGEIGLLRDLAAHLLPA